jgi:hypothetical protein
MPDDNNPLMQIKEVIDSNVRYATIDDLKRGGNRRFKVMKMGQFYSLVERAVNNVIRSESLTLAAEEKQRLIEESDLEFKRLLTERQGELRTSRTRRRNSCRLGARRTISPSRLRPFGTGTGSSPRSFARRSSETARRSGNSPTRSRRFRTGTTCSRRRSTLSRSRLARPSISGRSRSTNRGLSR